MAAASQENTFGLDEPIQYLTFTLDGEFFATDISQVREVLELTRITRVPRTPYYMRGVINLRGSVVPVGEINRVAEKETDDG